MSEHPLDRIRELIPPNCANLVIRHAHSAPVLLDHGLVEKLFPDGVEPLIPRDVVPDGLVVVCLGPAMCSAANDPCCCTRATGRMRCGLACDQPQFDWGVVNRAAQRCWRNDQIAISGAYLFSHVRLTVGGSFIH